jgi:hypothetical protein
LFFGSIKDDGPDAMKTVPFVGVWTFVLLAAGYDTYFAWQYRAGFQKWEMNSFVCWLAEAFGLGAVFGFKVVGMAFATAVAVYCHRHQPRLEISLSLIIGSVYLLLSVHYLVGFLA